MQDLDLKNEIESLFRTNADKEFSVENIADELKYHGSAAFKLIVQELAVLEREGVIIAVSDDNFKMNPEKQKLVGTFHANDKGFGFVAYDEVLPDAYIAPDNTMNALNGDTVEIEIVKAAKSGSDRGPEGKVVAITERKYQTVVGGFTQTDDDKGYYGQVKLTDKKIAKYKFYITDVGLKPTTGEVITAEIVEYPSKEHPDYMVGIAKSVIGSVDDPGIDILQIVYAHDIPSEFPQEVLEAADNIPDHVTEEEMQGREDITNQTLVTIDGESSKDLDDAVTVWKLDNGNYHLGVHIADVSHYVTPGNVIDKEAYKRGTSVYLTDRVIPMLPRRLSNGICSLNEGVLRLCVSCDMEIDPDGNIVKHRIHPSVMKSKARMTYTAVNQILEAHDENTRAQYKELVPMFEDMAELHRILYKNRKRNGSIDFDDHEAEIIVDENGKAVDIKLRVRGLSEKMIESFMLAANETVAQDYYEKNVPFIYRIHESPDADRIKNFFEFLTAFGINVKGDPDHVSPKTLQNILKRVAGQPEETMVSVMMLRSLSQAKYSEQSLGHFGLAAPYYTHFTSPIRRYPDTTVHRLIHYYDDNGINAESKKKYADVLDEIAIHSSETERRAVDAERDTDAMKKAEYMADHVGEEFEAVISSVLKFGMFVELPNTVEGLVHISRMNDDYYEYVDKFMALVGKNTKRTYKMGQPIRVKVVNVDVEQSAVDFEVVNPEDTPTSDWLPKQPSHNNKRRDNRNGSKNGDHKRSNNDRKRNNNGHSNNRKYSSHKSNSKQNNNH